VVRLAEPLELARDLERELARGREDQRARAGPAGEALDDREEERGGLAGAGRGDADDVLARERRRDRLRLDRRGVLEARALERVEGLRGELQIAESQGDLGAGGAGARGRPDGPRGGVLRAFGRRRHPAAPAGPRRRRAPDAGGEGAAAHDDDLRRGLRRAPRGARHPAR
jgi:hypothetical protein